MTDAVKGSPRWFHEQRAAAVALIEGPLRERQARAGQQPIMLTVEEQRLLDAYRLQPPPPRRERRRKRR